MNDSVKALINYFSEYKAEQQLVQQDSVMFMFWLPLCKERYEKAKTQALMEVSNADHYELTLLIQHFDSQINGS
jgi:hypothetical protein